MTETKLLRFHDRDNWPAGEWDNEPDELTWVDKATGLRCAILHNYLGCLCGYVGVPASSRYHGMSYHSIENVIDVHGGLTFSGDHSDVAEYLGEKVESDLWWFGFDCAHSYDGVPAPFVRLPGLPGMSYKNIAYVKKECASLAKQLK